jgi:ribonuclease BN (tRNA processing enzyme)
MKLRAFHASDGDCLLVSDDSNTRHLLVDGGRSETFKKHTLPALTMPTIDAVCVSHIDDDHISGIVAMFAAEVEWRRHEFEKAASPAARPPTVPRPPKVKEVWHNALFALVGEDLEIKAQTALALSANLLRVAGREIEAESTENLVTGEQAGMELARRLSPQQLDITLNGSSDGKLMTVDTARRRRIGGLSVKVLGPSQDDIDRLRTSWQNWLDKSSTKVDDLRRRLRADELSITTDAEGTPVEAALGAGVAGITPPNLASITLLVEQGDTSLLLTGDADSDEILHGLGHHHRLSPDGFHATVLKVQHHGAIANVTQDFVDQITVPWGTLIVVVILAVVAAVIAAVYPALKASRMNVLEAIATE